MYRFVGLIYDGNGQKVEKVEGGENEKKKREREKMIERYYLYSWPYCYHICTFKELIPSTHNSPQYYRPFVQLNV